MAFFGAPIVQPDHARRAVSAACKLVENVKAWNLERVARGDPPVGVRIGVNTGNAVVGDIGSAQRVDYTVLGNTVNVAARIEALAAVERLGIPVLVEDSGLALPAWKGYPGPLTKYAVGAVGEAGFARLAHAWGDPRAEAVSTLALAWPGAGSEEFVVAEGRVVGSLAAEPRGGNGFGWDVIFVPEGETRTFAEMSAEEKEGRSHRARAFAELVRMLASGDRAELG